MYWAVGHPPRVPRTRPVSTTSALTRAARVWPAAAVTRCVPWSVIRPSARVPQASPGTRSEPAATQSRSAGQVDSADQASSASEASVQSPAPRPMRTVCPTRCVSRAPADLCVTATRIVTLDTSARRDSVWLAAPQTPSVERPSRASTPSVRTPVSTLSVAHVPSVQSIITRPSAPVPRPRLVTPSLAASL